MFGPYTPTLMAILTRRGFLKLAPRAFPAGALRGEVAVVTGAAAGIGAALARRCARDGAKALVLADIAWDAPADDGDTASESSGDPADPASHPLVRECEALGAEVLPLAVDVGDRAALQRMHDACVDAFGAPRLLFNNAGTGMPGVLSADEASLRRSVDINFWSVVDGMRLFIPTMEAAHGDGAGGGAPCYVVNTASLAGVSESTGLYGVTKHAVVAATESVASELAWRRSCVAAAALCPSYVNSDVVRTTARAGLTGSAPAHLSEDEVAAITEELAGLGTLVAGGMACDDVASCVFDGMARGARYIYTDAGHTDAALMDRFEQMRAGGLFAGFKRRMEDVVAEALGRA